MRVSVKGILTDIKFTLLKFTILITAYQRHGDKLTGCVLISTS
jgi:hypothetical protein